MCRNVLEMFHMDIQIGKYTNMESFTLWRWRFSWIYSLVNIAKQICSENYSTAWNGYPRNLLTLIVKRSPGIRTNYEKETKNDVMIF